MYGIREVPRVPSFVELHEVHVVGKSHKKKGDGPYKRRPRNVTIRECNK